MSISKLEDEIFSEWKRSRPDLVADGVANEQEYLACRETILFVLKEVNDPGGGSWDLRQFMCEGGRPQTWNNITRWVEGIRAAPDDIPWKELSFITAQRRMKALRSVAAINLKKSPGGHTTDPAELGRVAAEDRNYLNRQFSLYCADWVICCGAHVTDTFHRLIDSLAGADWKATSRGIYYHEYAPGKYIIAYSHPEARVADSLLHYGLVDAVKEIRAPRPNHSPHARQP